MFRFYLLLSLLSLSFSLSFLDSTCSPYDSGTNNCASCGTCFNPGGRSGVLCKSGTNSGYYCPPEPQSGSDAAYACMDWTFGSLTMKRQEEAFNARTGNSIYFGVGTYGTSNDPQRGLGACYRLVVSGLDRDLIVQSINTGSDVDGNQFDMQVGCGGAGAFNSCAGGAAAMFPGDYTNWGHIYGGVDHRDQCSLLPPYPNNPNPMKEAQDSLVTLCQYSFDKKVRIDQSGASSNPSIQSVNRVQCPEELVFMTQMQRNDEPEGYERGTVGNHVCGEAGNAWCLTRMMDCRKPSGAVKDNVVDKLMVKGRKIVQPCTADGYTRIDVQCGCFNCYC